jgi:hypothetical protein
MGGGDGDCGRSLIALVDSLLRAIFLSEGGGGRCLSSSGGVSDELGSWTGCGLNVAILSVQIARGKVSLDIHFFVYH